MNYADDGGDDDDGGGVHADDHRQRGQGYHDDHG